MPKCGYFCRSIEDMAIEIGCLGPCSTRIRV